MHLTVSVHATAFVLAHQYPVPLRTHPVRSLTFCFFCFLHIFSVGLQAALFRKLLCFAEGQGDVFWPASTVLTEYKAKSRLSLQAPAVRVGV